MLIARLYLRSSRKSDLGVIHFRCETLLAPGITRKRPCATDISGNDSAVMRQQSQRPLQVFDGKPPALPIGHSFFRAQAIEIDRDIDLDRAQPPNELRELLPPVAP